MHHLFCKGTGDKAVNVLFAEYCSTSFFLPGSFCDHAGSSSQQFFKVRSQVSFGTETGSFFIIC